MAPTVQSHNSSSPSIFKSLDGRVLLSRRPATRDRFLRAVKAAEQAQKAIVDLGQREIQDRDRVNAAEWLNKIDRYTDEPYSRGGIPMPYRDFYQVWSAFIECQEQEWVASITGPLVVAFALTMYTAYSHFVPGDVLQANASNLLSQDLHRLLWIITGAGTTIIGVLLFALSRMQEPSKGLEMIQRVGDHTGFMILDLVCSMPAHYVLLMNVVVGLEIIAQAILSYPSLSTWLSQVIPPQIPIFTHFALKTVAQATYGYPVLMLAIIMWFLGSIHGRAALITMIQSKM
ncbi:hypothetical protein NP233_g10466 [Leucocoprinus birnbaumii]|uniref:Uncharacterized protein n=1 Tax=Leucocoprinus birnbaumii TaxID=56174 RepID=A0AAD5YM54_9AGAR|nr:hypothetical protein NP233_g10466 [Leucocoprinus birnbaumii]